ncbi:MAG TPA: DUF1800 domain-containing protein [Candidatus Methylacidiphilales bacterium]|jgi:hypothetical protein|nr:DUF1800 domain-containing protein [Candidatus Methylacidiphilales bacterium]
MLEPLPGSHWNTTTAAHLMNRAGFGGSPSDIENLREMGLGKAVSWFIDYGKIPDNTPAPDWAHPDPDAIARREAINKAADPETRRLLQQQENQDRFTQMADLRYWWIRRMALGPRPFQEKMTLFWHGHFATSFEKVEAPYFLWLQNETLRQNAVGNFNQLLIAASEDPAMLLYLDGARSNRNNPNENFAREVMELFTLGEGHYTEQDIQQAAKAYTGWGIGGDHLHYEYNRNNHDDGPKTIFGQTGNFTGEDVLNMICAKPECAQFIAKKLWRFFAQDQPPQPIVDALAAEFHSHDMDIRHLMRAIFTSKEFYAPDVIRSQIKSPVQWLIAATRQLQAPLPTQAMTLVMLSQLGEELFNPPNVKGWDGGIAWITTNNLLDRYNFAAALVEGDRVPLPGLLGKMKGVLNNMAEDGLLQTSPTDVSALFSTFALSNPYSFLNALQARFLNAQLAPQRMASFNDFLKSKSPLEETDIRKAIRLIMCTPEYQLT